MALCRPTVVAVGIAVGSVAGPLISETTGLFGFIEDGYRSAIALSLLFEGASIVLLGTYPAYSKEMGCLALSAT